MREPNFKIGWLINRQIAALTHFHSDIRDEDIQGVMRGASELLANVSGAFHLIIDNRQVNMPSLMTLEQLRNISPIIQHPHLHTVVVVKPKSLDIDTNTLEIEKLGQLRLKNVSTVEEGIAYLQASLGDIAWDNIENQFFPNATLQS